MIIQAEQAEVMARTVAELRLQTSMPAPAPATPHSAPEYHADYLRESLTLQRNQQVIDQLTSTLEKPQGTLATVLAAQNVTTRPPAPAIPPQSAPPKAWTYTPVPPMSEAVADATAAAQRA